MAERHRTAAVVVAAGAVVAGVELLSLSRFDVGPPSQPGITLGYGAIPNGRIDEDLGRLRAAFDRH